jgi:4-hydroxy-3-polyprenylbenzoate decarboxylase
MQGYPVEFVKARTVDAMSIAEAEYVIEGYLDTTQKVWESEIAEKEQRQGVHPFHPEWAGYMGKAYRTYKFQVTAVTHRKDKPIYYPSIVHSYDDKHIDTLMREAMFFELADRICPGLCIDTRIPMPMTDWGGVIFQIKKRRARDEGFQKNILTAAASCSMGLRLTIAVDEDINIYSVDDMLWALTTRIDPRTGIQIVAQNGAGQTFQPADRSSAGDKDWTQSNIRFGGCVTIDCTMPFRFKDAFERPPYPVKLVDPSNWFTPEQISSSIAKMTEYGKFMAKTGF